MNFMYTIDPNAETPIMLINKHIGFDKDEGFGIMGDQFQQELLALDAAGKRRVEVWINSPGGVVTDGYNICMAILNSKCKVDTYCRGLAASIAGVIFMCGRSKIMADYGILMMHNPFGGDDNEALDKIKNSIATLIAARTGKTEGEILAYMKKTTWMDASEAIDAGLCDEVEISGDSNVGRLSRARNNAPEYWKLSNSILNKILKPEQKMTFSKVTNRLQLVEGANEEQILNAIEAIEIKAKASEEDCKKAKKDMDEAKAAYDKLKDAYDKLAKEKEEAEEKEKKAKSEAVTNSAKVMVEGFKNKIGSDEKVIEKWVNVAISLGVDEAKAMIEAIPVNKSAARLSNESVNGEVQVGSVINRTMADTRVKYSI